jgi:RND family efflux transporter MFP subunit
MKIFTTKVFAGVVLSVVTVFIVQSCVDSSGQGKSIPKTAEPIPVKVIALSKSSADAHIITSGQLTTDDEATLGFKTGGVVQAVYVREGDRISKGQVLATLDLTEINAIADQAKLGFEKAERDLARVKNLYKDSVATLEQLQNTETAYELAKAQLNSVNFNRSFSQIKAPASGFVLKKFVNAGQVVGVGDPVLRTNGAGNSQWILKSGVSDKQWSGIKVGDNATVSVDAFPGKTFEGKVIRKSETADQATGAFTVEIGVRRSDVKFAAGMFASADLHTSKTTTSWTIPYDAVLDANGNDGFVFTTSDSKTAVKTPVTIESFNNESIRISQGLENADALIVSGSAYLTDQSPITIVN